MYLFIYLYFTGRSNESSIYGNSAFLSELIPYSSK